MTSFDLTSFTPYLLAIAAENASRGFQRYYKDRYGMLRTEWRVVFHLGRYGEMTAKEICARAHLHKTKVSRAVAALEAKRFLVRSEMQDDRRHEQLKLTAAGTRVFKDLAREAHCFDQALMADFTPEERAVLHKCLNRLADG